MEPLHIEKLQEFGLTEKEARVYLAALQLGSATAEQISKLAEVNRSTTYVQIEQMMQRGLMSTHEEGKKTMFTAESPEHLKRIYQKRVEDLQNEVKAFDRFVPELQRLYDSAGERPVVRFFQGKEGLITMRNEVLKAKEKKMLIASSHDHMTEVFTWDELMQYSEKRAKKNITPRVIYTKTGDDIPVVPPIELRRVDKDDYPFESEVYIYDNTVALASLHGYISGVIIENKAIAKSMKTLYELAWKEAGDESLSSVSSKL